MITTEPITTAEQLEAELRALHVVRRGEPHGAFAGCWVCSCGHLIRQPKSQPWTCQMALDLNAVLDRYRPDRPVGAQLKVGEHCSTHGAPLDVHRNCTWKPEGESRPGEWVHGEERHRVYVRLEDGRLDTVANFGDYRDAERAVAAVNAALPVGVSAEQVEARLLAEFENDADYDPDYDYSEDARRYARAALGLGVSE